MGLDLTLQNGLLDWLKGTAFPPAPVAIYLSLHSDTEASALGEVSGTLGGRVPIPASLLSDTRYLDGESDGTRQIVNTQAILTELATEAVGVRSFGIWDAPTGGTRLLWGDVDPEVSIALGDPGVFLGGDLSLRIR